MVAAGFLKKGFTLVELLIAMSIMLTMLVLAGTAYQLYTDSWKRDLSRIDNTFTEFRHFELALDAMQAVLPLAVTDSGGRAYYFLGREEGFTAVTYAPVYHIGFPAVIRVFREHNDNGSFRLVYEEASLEHIVLKDASQNLPFSYRQVIADNLTALSFSYYGWDNINSRTNSAEAFSDSFGKTPQWYSEFDAFKRNIHPERLKVTLGDFYFEFNIANRDRVNASFAAEDPV